MHHRLHQHEDHIVKGSLLAILTFFFMAVFGVLTKVATQNGDDIWVSFITYFVAAIGTCILILPQGKASLKSQHYALLIARAVIGTAASFLYMISLHYIPAVNATLLFNTAPIFIPIISVVVLKSYVQRSVWYAVVLGFIGILVIVKPSREIFTDPGNLIGLASGIALAFAYLYVKMLTATDSGLRIIFYYFVIGTIMQIPLLMFAKPFPATDIVVYAAICGLTLLLAQLFLVRAYLYAAASEVGVYQYSSVVFVGIIEWMFWSITPDSLDCLGYVLVTIAGVIIIHTGVQRRKKSM